MPPQTSQSSTIDPLSDSLWGEYARILLLGAAACSAAAWATQITTGPQAVVMIFANIVIIGVTVGDRFAGLPRLAGLLVLAAAVLGVFASSQDTLVASPPESIFLPIFTLVALALLLARDGWIAARSHAASIPLRPVAIGVVLTGLTIYMVVVPAVNAILEPYRDRPSSYVVEELSPLEVLRVRSAKLSVFAIFAYAGACWGSFLNVAAASLPRGETIALRSSACPDCQTPISRLDNLPIISYLRLGGRCRACNSEIPKRYLLVELCGMSIFSLLFLYELVTGAANVPEFPTYHYTGIVWIILYTKWPVVGIYLYHCGLMCVLLTLGLMESDRRRCPRSCVFVLGVAFAVLPVIAPTLLPVGVDRHLPIDISSSLPVYLAQAVAVAFGGIAGALLGWSAKRSQFLQGARDLPIGFTLIGVALGWQAVLTIGVLFFATVWLGSTSVGWTRGKATRWATMLLLLVTMIHHPFWRTIDNLW